MRIEIDGSPDDLIERCRRCKHCIFENILREDQRKIKVLKKKIDPKKHPHRHVIEQLCGKQYDGVCPMKYAAMRASFDDRTAVQMAVVKNYVWDMGKRYKEHIPFAKAMKKWTTLQDLGLTVKESRAQRYKEIWNRGVRNIIIDNNPIENQILTADLIYEIIMTEADEYINWLEMLDILKQEHKKRDSQ